MKPVATTHGPCSTGSFHEEDDWPSNNGVWPKDGEHSDTATSGDVGSVPDCSYWSASAQAYEPAQPEEESVAAQFGLSKAADEESVQSNGSSSSAPLWVSASSWLDTIGTIGDACWELPPEDPEYWSKQAVRFSGYLSSSEIENAVRQSLRLPKHLLRMLTDKTYECLQGDLSKRRQWLNLMNLVAFDVLAACPASVAGAEACGPPLENIDEIRRLILMVVEAILEDDKVKNSGTFELVKVSRQATLMYFLVGNEAIEDIPAWRVRRVLKTIALRSLAIPLGDRGVTPLGKLSYMSLYGQSLGSTLSLDESEWTRLIDDQLELEFEEFVQTNQESTQDRQRKEEFATLIETLIEEELGLKCHPYGSRVTGLTLRDSDLDLGVRCPEFLRKNGQQLAPGTSRPWNHLSERSLPTRLACHAFNLVQNAPRFSQSGCTIDLRANARKPLIRFVAADGELSADLVFGWELAGCRNSTLLAHYSRLDPRVRPLVIFIKHWSKRRFVNGNYIGFLSSFGHTLTVIDFLQKIQPPVLPNVQMPHFDDDAVVFADEDASQDFDQLNRLDLPWQDWSSDNEMSLCQLLRAYFAYMAFECPWVTQVVSPRSAPTPMLKRLTFVLNNPLNATLTSATPTTREGWIYCHPRHTLRECVNDRSQNLVATFSRLCVEDPSERERLLVLHRPYAQDQTTFEHMRACVLLEAGQSLAALCTSLLPLASELHSSHFINMDRLRATPWWKLHEASGKNHEDEIAAHVRSEPVATLVNYLRQKESGRLFPEEEAPGTSLVAQWRRSGLMDEVARCLIDAEDTFNQNYLLDQT